MNLDDFINNENVGTPAGLALTPSAETSKIAEDKPVDTLGASSSAIPIKSRKEKEPAHLMVPQSVPVAANLQRAQDEFGYIPRHPRKTSIDETNRLVSSFPGLIYAIGGELSRFGPPGGLAQLLPDLSAWGGCSNINICRNSYQTRALWLVQ